MPASPDLKSEIERLYASATVADTVEARRIFDDFRASLTRGESRAAEKVVDDKGESRWTTNAWVKQGILLGFRLGELKQMSDGDVLSFIDKDTFPARRLTLSDRVRLVPGGSSIREGAYVAPSVICLPPMFINVGAYVDEGTMIDSHALVGSCAQIGKRVHVSAAAQIGGVLEPINAAPVIIEDDVLIAPCWERAQFSRDPRLSTIWCAAKSIALPRISRLKYPRMPLSCLVQER